MTLKFFERASLTMRRPSGPVAPNIKTLFSIWRVGILTTSGRKLLGFESFPVKGLKGHD